MAGGEGGEAGPRTRAGGVCSADWASLCTVHRLGPVSPTLSSCKGTSPSCLGRWTLCVPKAELLPGTLLALTSVSGTNGYTSSGCSV